MGLPDSNIPTGNGFIAFVCKTCNCAFWRDKKTLEVVLIRIVSGNRIFEVRCGDYHRGEQKNVSIYDCVVGPPLYGRYHDELLSASIDPDCITPSNVASKIETLLLLA